MRESGGRPAPRTHEARLQASTHPLGGSAPFDLILLRTFVEVVELGGFALAADRLALTPSAVSGHIRRLEETAGAKLLARTTRSFQLTPAGETLYAYARNIVNLEQEARARLRGALSHERIRIGASEDFAGTWLPQVLQTFQHHYPGASVTLQVGITADLVKALERGQVDIVFGKQCARVPEGGTLLWEEALVWAFGAACAFDPDAELPLAMFPEPCVYREAAIDALTRAGRPWRLAFESGSMAGCVAAARAGFAVTPIAASQLRDGLRVLGTADGLPPLPDARFHVFARHAPRLAQELIAAVKDTGAHRRFGATQSG